MNAILFVLVALLVGLATGKLVGAGLTFTHGRPRDDLVAGLVGAIVGALPLHFLGPAGYREALPALLIGLSAAMLATWLRRIATWKKEPIWRTQNDAPDPSQDHYPRDLLTTAEGSKLLLSRGRLALEEPDVVRPLPGVVS